MANQNPASFREASVSLMLTAIRILAGWHFLYEGITKLFNPSWSSSAYLLESTWIFSGFFKAMATDHSLLQVVDFLNIWGLILIGLGLFLGFFTRTAAWSGALLLFLYYLARPPFTGLMEGSIAEGSYIWVNKNLIEMLVLILLAVIPAGWMYGLDNLIRLRKRITETVPASTVQKDTALINDVPMEVNPETGRRMIIKNLIALPFMGGFVYAALKNYFYERGEKQDEKLEKRTDAVSSASTKFKTFAGLADLKEQVPKSRIANLDISRLICGGNLLSGISHSRDLHYVDELMKQYFTTDKVWETFRICEACGINSALFRTDTHTVRLIHKYWKQGGKMQWLAQTKFNPGDEDVTTNAQIALDSGASAIYIQGNNADSWVMDGKFENFDRWFSHFQGKGLPLGCGAHEIDVVKEMEGRGYPVDFYMKTIHDSNYWSFQPDEPKVRTITNNRDNYWCREPEETIRYMETVNKPWIGFKILAAGAIRPARAFKYALENGADFVCVGMFDYQVVEDCNILTDTLKNISGRRRRIL